MYYHEEGYFSTEPVWNDYPRTSTGNFTMEDEVWNFQANTKNIKTGEEKIIHKFKNYFSANVYVQGDYLVVRDQDKYIFVKWNSVY